MALCAEQSGSAWIGLECGGVAVSGGDQYSVLIQETFPNIRWAMATRGDVLGSRLLPRYRASHITKRPLQAVGGVTRGDVPGSRLLPRCRASHITKPGPIDGIVLANKIRQKYQNLSVLFMTGWLPEREIGLRREWPGKGDCCESRRPLQSCSSLSIRIWERVS
jgi:hypothetical protein